MCNQEPVSPSRGIRGASVLSQWVWRAVADKFQVTQCENSGKIQNISDLRKGKGVSMGRFVPCLSGNSFQMEMEESK